VSTASSTASGDWFTVARAVDGDTVELADGTKVRYVGVNTPETHHPTKGVQCYGKEAAAYNQTLVAGKKVRLVKDVSETDRYGRLLRFVYLEDGTLVNRLLLEQGYAEVMTYPPDVAKSKEFIAVQAEARAAKRGLWGFCSSTTF
jgi:micrococcal nuclease